MPIISEQLALAIQHHQAGRLRAAEEIYRQVLTIDSRQPAALHLLGVIAHQVGRHDVAIELIEAAIKVHGTEAAFHVNLGEAYRALHRLAEAIACYERALQLQPDFADAYLNLGNAFKDLGRLDEAAASYRRAVDLQPDFAIAHNNLGNVRKEQGRLDEAIVCYEAALRLKPDFAEAYYNLGVALEFQKRFSEAAACYQSALRARPDYAEAHNNLGNVHKEQGRLEEAAACYLRALGLKPDFAGAHNNLGNIRQARGLLPEAITCYERALALNPSFAEAHNNLGTALKDQGRLHEAIACFEQTLRFMPYFAEAHYNLGNALDCQGRSLEAIACYRRAVHLRPDYAEGHNNLGSVLKEQGLLDEAMACYRRALELKPDFAEAHNNLGTVFKVQERLDEASSCYVRALQLKPDYAEAHNNLGTVRKDQGRLTDAIACFRRAVELNPEAAAIHSNLAYSLHFCPGYDAQAIREEQCRWDRRHAGPLARLQAPHVNDPSPNRLLRIGYVSPDFSLHPVGRFLLPLLQAHDHESVQVFCYSSVAVPDKITEDCRTHADVWRDVLGRSDADVAQAIRQDLIDILVDLTMHMGNNRLLVFARKPAPVQVTYLAYGGTTGLTAMDYRLTDPYLDPRGQNGQFYVEESVYLPESYWCYRPPLELPEVAALPVLVNRYMTFGCLNNFCKVTEPTLEAWSRLLAALPEARLLLHARAGSHRDAVRAFFVRRQVASERVTFLDLVPLPRYFSTYESFDIALDPFPYGGGTTTCDALWMGVPVVSLAGQTAVGRAGLSILSNVGLAELVAHDADKYVRLALDLAQDVRRLRELRAGLRDRLRASPLLNASSFARNVEAAYRVMWQRWCAGVSQGVPLHKN
jgi:protein O-GlcNAc transferase